MKPELNTTKTEASRTAALVGSGPLVRLFLVVWDDEMGVCVPMVRDADCEGAICGGYSTDKIALFRSRADARKAINISAKFAQLQRAQGKPENTDFLEGRKNLRIRECA